MKKTVLAALLALLIGYALSYAAVKTHPDIFVSPSPAPIPVESGEEPPDTICVKHGDTVEETALREYLIGVVAAEMPAGFETEALKAQSVAARTYAMYCMSTSRHADADVCDDYRCCQAWSSEDALREKWGADYDALHSRIESAVDATAGQTLRYRGEPILAAFHSSSDRRTESSAEVWGGALPYLVSVDSPENAATVPNFVSTVELDALDFRDTLLHEHGEADFSGDPETWIGEVEYTDGGRVDAITLGGVRFTGRELRELFALRSTDLTLDYSDGVFVFTVTGFGHGVGMSQYGAQRMASEGAGYRDILAHYYPGTKLSYTLS